MYTDSAYVVGAVPVELSQWIKAGLLTAAKTHIKHEKDMKSLTAALMKPSKIAVVKCKGHDKIDSMVARGNNEADRAAKRAAGHAPQYMMTQTEKTIQGLPPQCDADVLIKEQGKASPPDISVCTERGARQTDGPWRSPDKRPVLPLGLMTTVLQEAHGLTHCDSKQMQRHLTHWWHPFVPAIIKNQRM